MSPLKKRAYFWVTLVLFLLSLMLHWIFAWTSFKGEQQAHHQPIIVTEYVQQTMRDTMENWQSEFLQLIWQVVGLSMLYYVGSPSSKEGDDRREEKLDYILQKLEPEKAKELIHDWDKKYPRK